MNSPIQFSLRRLLAAVALCCLGAAGIRLVLAEQFLPGGWFWDIAALFPIATSFAVAVCLVARKPLQFACWSLLLIALSAIFVPVIGFHGPKPSPINNLHNFAEAMIMFESQHGRLPARANFDANGRPLLSWRVHILPIIQQQALYDQFHLDEPWDSPHNQTLIQKMPAIYASPPRDASDHRTAFLIPTGEGTIFAGQSSMTLDAISKGNASNTILVVEVDADHSVIWTKPEDLEINFDYPLSGLGHARPNGFVTSFADGSARFVPTDCDPNTIRAMFMPDGGKAMRAAESRLKAEMEKK